MDADSVAVGAKFSLKFAKFCEIPEAKCEKFREIRRYITKYEKDLAKFREISENQFAK